MKKLLVLLPLVLSLGSFLQLSSFAEEETVNATITPLVISMSLSTNSVSYGTQQATGAEVVSNPESITVTNTGTVAQDFTIKGSNSTSGEWTLDTTAGTNQFVHRFSTNNSTFTDLDTSTFKALQTNVTPSNNFLLYMRLVVPSTITNTAVQTLPIKILAVQHP